jgi:serine/threonine protein kinase
MGSVYEVREKATGMHYALKMLKEQLVTDKEAVTRLHREARTAMNLSHKNLCTIYGAETSTKGVPYLLMELIEGESLAAVLEQEIFITSKRAVPIFMQLCDGLSHAHKRHVLHRDLKPGNVIIWNWAKGSNRLRLVDFGIAKSLAPASTSATNQLTQTGELIGSPFYMSPEQCRGEQLGPQSDIYSLGCVMYEVLTGKPPFTGNNPVTVIVHHLNDRPERFNRSLGVPPALEAIVLKCLEKSLSARYQSIDALYEDLDAFNQGAAPAVDLEPKQTRTATVGTPRWSAPLRLTLCIIAALVLLTLALNVRLSFTSPSLKTAEQHRFEIYDSKPITTTPLLPESYGSISGANVRLVSEPKTGQRYLRLDIEPDAPNNIGILEELANIHFCSAVDGLFESMVSIRKAGDKFIVIKGLPSSSRFGELEVSAAKSWSFIAANGGMNDCQGIYVTALPLPLRDFFEPLLEPSQKTQPAPDVWQGKVLKVISLKVTGGGNHTRTLEITSLDARHRSIPLKVSLSEKDSPERIDMEIPDPTANLKPQLWQTLPEALRLKLKAEHSSGQPMNVSVQLPSGATVAKSAADQEALTELKRISGPIDKHG